VLAGAEVGDRLSGRGLAALGLTHGSGADPAATNGVTSTSHVSTFPQPW
jgi:hypothetical protein